MKRALYVTRTDLSGKPLIFNVRDQRYHIAVMNDVEFVVRDSNSFLPLSRHRTLPRAKAAMRTHAMWENAFNSNRGAK